MMEDNGGTEGGDTNVTVNTGDAPQPEPVGDVADNNDKQDAEATSEDDGSDDESDDA